MIGIAIREPRVIVTHLGSLAAENDCCEVMNSGWPMPMMGRCGDRRTANLLSFNCLKAFALDQRNERKDAHDLIYCIEHGPKGLDTAAGCVPQGTRRQAWRCRSILRKRFASDRETEGYRKDGPVSVAKFELGEHGDAGIREARLLRQREVSDLIERLLSLIDGSSAP